MSSPTVLRAGILCGVAAGAITLAAPSTAQRIIVDGTPQTVWRWSASTKCDGGNDFPDVPARPFLVGSKVLWFASNSGRYASVGITGGVDILASLQRGVDPGSPPTCVQWVAAVPRQSTAPYYPGSVPSTYNTALWMASPFNDGTTVHALMHNEFHGDWTGSTEWCPTLTPTEPIYLPCSYWNIVGARAQANEIDSENTFQLNQSPFPDGMPPYTHINVPAIALANPYVVPTSILPATEGPQGMTAQSNILRSGDYYYVLALQLQAPNAADPSLNGTCVWRAPVSRGPLVWAGWDGWAWTIAAPTRYLLLDPAISQPFTTSPPLCKPVLPAIFRFSWSFYSSPYVGSVLVVMGQDTLTNLRDKNVTTDSCPYAPGASASTADAAFVYIVKSDLPGIGTPWWTGPTTNTEYCLLQINSMDAPSSLTRHAYPSLLDPQSPEILQGDFNFQTIGNSPYVYFTQMNPVGEPANPQGWDRDLLRIQTYVTIW